MPNGQTSTSVAVGKRLMESFLGYEQPAFDIERGLKRSRDNPYEDVFCADSARSFAMSWLHFSAVS